MTQQWKLIDSAPKTGRTLLLGYWNSHGKWRTVRGQWMSAEYIGQEWEEPDDVEAGWFETAVEADDVPNCWPVSPSHWQPMPEPPCQTCNDQGAVGNILNAEPCPECTPPASAQDDAKVYHFEQRSRFGPWIEVEKPTERSVEFVQRSAAPAAGDARIWHGLTDAERDGYVGELVDYGTDFVSPLYSVVESIEKRLREKNAASQQQEG